MFDLGGLVMILAFGLWSIERNQRRLLAQQALLLPPPTPEQQQAAEALRQKRDARVRRTIAVLALLLGIVIVLVKYF